MDDDLYRKIVKQVQEKIDKSIYKTITPVISMSTPTNLTLDKLHAIRTKIKPYIEPKEFRQEYLAEWNNTFMNNEKDFTTPHTERAGSNPYELNKNKVHIQGSGLTGTLEVGDETATLTINVAGVEPDNIEVTRIDSTLRVRVHPEQAPEFEPASQSYNTRSLELILASYESIGRVAAELGMLYIEIDRERDIQHFEVEG
jgi:HSP20 family molecular chaperone IbpA